MLWGYGLNVTRIFPTFGSCAGGTRVTIQGSGFEFIEPTKNAVNFGTAPCIVMNATAEQIVCQTTEPSVLSQVSLNRTVPLLQFYNFTSLQSVNVLRNVSYDDPVFVNTTQSTTVNVTIAVVANSSTPGAYLGWQLVPINVTVPYNGTIIANSSVLVNSTVFSLLGISNFSEIAPNGNLTANLTNSVFCNTTVNSTLLPILPGDALNVSAANDTTWCYYRIPFNSTANVTVPVNVSASLSYVNATTQNQTFWFVNVNTTQTVNRTVLTYAGYNVTKTREQFVPEMQNVTVPLSFPP